jgi:hypothetical protein
MDISIKYMAIIVAIIVCLSVGIYFYKKNNTLEYNEELFKPQMETENIFKRQKIDEELPEFINSKWVGSKTGYVFYRSDKHGLGYHLDTYKRDSNGKWVLK